MEKTEGLSARRVANASTRWRAPWTWRLAMSAGASATGLVAVGILALLAPAPTNQLVTSITNGFGGSSLATVWPFLLLIVVVSVTVTLGVYHLVRDFILIQGWRRYLTHVASELSEQTHRHARLVALGYIPQARVAQAGTPGNPQREPLAAALMSFPRVLLLGDDGAGKSIALQRLALEIARSARLGRMLTGRQLVPIVVSFARYAAADPDESGIRVAFLVERVRHYGARILAGQLPTLLRRGRVALLLDGLDEVQPAIALAVLRELHSGLRGVYQNVRIVMTCRTAASEALLTEAPLLKFLTSLQLLPLSMEEGRQIIRRAGRAGALGVTAPETILTEIDRRDLWPIITSPATLAMLIELVGASQMLPATRAQLIAAYEHLLLQRLPHPPAPIILTRRALGLLALALRLTGNAEITGTQAWNERDAVKTILADTTSAATALGGASRPIPRLDEQDLASALEAAVQAGILERGSDGSSLKFQHSLLLYLAAARHFDTHDAGLGRISPMLLRPEWMEILILWGGLTTDPTGLAERISRFATTPAGVAAVARIADLAQVEPLAHALALTVGVVNLAHQVTIPPIDAADQAKSEISQQHLRDLFDRVLRYGVDDQQEEARNRLRMALRICESATAGELTLTLMQLVRSSVVNRILRAQAVQTLGLLASPSSLAALTHLLLEPDPIVRDALSRGFHLAGAEAAGALLDLLASYPVGETIHKRALDAIAAVDGPAVTPALERLHATEAALRAASAEALGVLRDRRAVDPLIAAIQDSQTSVQIAAMHALGRIGDLRAQQVILPLLQDSDEQKRMAAAYALGMMRSDRAYKHLIKLLEDAQPRVRAAAAEALGHIGDLRAADALRQHLSDRDAWAQAAAATALRALGQRN